MSQHPTPQGAASGATSGLERGLSNRHLQLIAIGGVNGTGLFFGSGKGVGLVGPLVTVVCMVLGFMLFFVKAGRALASLAPCIDP